MLLHEARRRRVRNGSRPCRITHGSGTSSIFRWSGPRGAALGHQPGVHRPESVYARCDDVDRPDYLHFDLDPARRGVRSRARDGARRARRARDAEDAVSREDHRIEGLHLLCQIMRGPLQRTWTFGRSRRNSPGATRADHGEYASPNARTAVVARRLQPERVGQDARVDLLAAPAAEATVSTPVTWKGNRAGVRIEDFTIRTSPRASPSSAICGNRLWLPAAGSTSRNTLST